MLRKVWNFLIEVTGHSYEVFVVFKWLVGASIVLAQGAHIFMHDGTFLSTIGATCTALMIMVGWALSCGFAMTLADHGVYQRLFDKCKKGVVIVTSHWEITLPIVFLDSAIYYIFHRESGWTLERAVDNLVLTIGLIFLIELALAYLVSRKKGNENAL